MFDLKIWRLHPQGVRFEKAEKTLHGTANPSGVKFCRPFSLANSFGWWIFPAIDIDITWDGENFSAHYLEEWPNTENQLVQSLVTTEDNVNVNDFCPIEGRSKFTFGSVEKNVVQFWTGCILQTPPGWCLQLRSPINTPNLEYNVMEGILETDWMFYDIWINVVFQVKNQWVRFRKNQFPPLAQIVPIRREGNDAPWEKQEEIVNRNTPEANDVFNYWLQYNKKKFSLGGNNYLAPDRTKDSTTFYKERQERLDKKTYEPRKKDVHSSCPNARISLQACPMGTRQNPSQLENLLPPHDNAHGNQA